jgi:hypothetical protein
MPMSKASSSASVSLKSRMTARAARIRHLAATLVEPYPPGPRRPRRASALGYPDCWLTVPGEHPPWLTRPSPIPRAPTRMSSCPSDSSAKQAMNARSARSRWATSEAVSAGGSRDHGRDLTIRLGVAFPWPRAGSRAGGGDRVAVRGRGAAPGRRRRASGTSAPQRDPPAPRACAHLAVSVSIHSPVICTRC